MLSEYTAAIQALQDVSSLLYERGWAFGTSGNYSIVLDRAPLRLLVTASGKDKRRLADGDFVIVAGDGAPIPGQTEKPSADRRRRRYSARSHSLEHRTVRRIFRARSTADSRL
jgi:methylthioribulose-1-phosphate dehydratase